MLKRLKEINFRAVSPKYWIAGMFFIIAMCVLMRHSEYLFALQSKSYFVGGHTFMTQMLSREHGVWIWIGCYLTQFFYHPWLGGIMLATVWVITYLCIAFMGGKHQWWWHIIAIIPVGLQLYATMTYGYWIYYSKVPGYVFAMSASMLAVSALSLLLQKGIWYFYKGYRIPVGIVIILISSIVMRPYLRVFSWSMPDERFYSELRMYNALDNCQWDEVLTEAQKCDSPTNLMVLYKNIALMQKGRMTDMFLINNCSSTPTEPAGLKLRIAQLGASMVYYQFGQINFAYRWAIENSVKYGMNNDNLKMLIRCSILNQEFDVANKYLAILRQNRNYRDWCYNREAEIYNSTRLIESEEFKAIAPLINDNADELDVDNGMCEKWILEHYPEILHPSTPKLEDVIMCTSLWEEDNYAFCLHFYDYVNRHQNVTIPTLYQEGAILLANEEGSPLKLNDFPFDPVVKERYMGFVNEYMNLTRLGVSQEEMGEKLKASYGNTFWWYYYFYTDMKLY